MVVILDTSGVRAKVRAKVRARARFRVMGGTSWYDWEVLMVLEGGTSWVRVGQG